MPEFDYDNENSVDENTIIELNTMDEDTSAMATSEVKSISDTEMLVTPSRSKAKKEKKVKNRRSPKEWWEDLSKKQKILVIVIPALILLIILGLCLYFFVFRKPKEEKPKENVVIEKDNYIYENGSLKLLDSKDKVIGTYECINKDAKKCYVAPLDNEDDFDNSIYVDSKGKKLTRTSKIYNEKYIFIYDDSKIMLYDIKKKETTGEYSLIKTGDIDKDYVVVKDLDEKYGILSISLNEVNKLLEPNYTYLGIIESSDVFVAKEDGYSYLVDTTGKAVSANLKGDIKKFNSKYISVYDDSYGLYNYEGVNVLSDSKIDFIDFIDNYILVVKNNRLYIYDETLFKLNEEGIKLKSEDYQKTYVFDDKNTLKDTRQAYIATTDTGAIKFELSDGTNKTINTYEATLSKQLPKVSYYEGVLYFYADDSKQDVIGTYSCTNPNEVGASTKELKNCFVARSENIVNTDKEAGYLPVVASQYVFITDSKDGNNTGITLYDLKGSSSLAKYQKVDTITRFNEVTYVDTLDDYVYAQSAKDNGYYGVINITSEGPKNVIKFEAKKMSYFNAQYLLVEKDKNYLYDLNDLTKEVASSNLEIIDYADGNLVVKDNGKYTVYNASGKVIKTSLDYYFLEPNYLVGITNNSVNLYNYADGKEILSESVKLETSDSKYENFKIETGNGYTIKVLKSDGTYDEVKFDIHGDKIKTSAEGEKADEEE